MTDPHQYPTPDTTPLVPPAIDSPPPPLPLPASTGLDTLTSLGGCLLCWGGGEFSQHGHGEGRKEVPTSEALIQDLTNVKLVACGASHAIVVTGKLAFICSLCIMYI